MTRKNLLSLSLAGSSSSTRGQFLPTASCLRFGLVAFGLGACLAVTAFGQSFKRPDGSVPVPVDWTSKHVLYTEGFTPSQAAKMLNEPRVYASWLLHGNAPKESGLHGNSESQSKEKEKEKGKGGDDEKGRPQNKKIGSIKTDWAIPLGTAGVAQGMSAAKFNFDVNSTPNCTSDFAVFPIGASTGATRGKIVGTFSTTLVSGTGTVTLTVTPTGASAINLSLTASTTLNTGTNFQVATVASGPNATANALNLAVAINRNLPGVAALGRIVAIASTNTVSVYTLTSGDRVPLTAPATVTNLTWAVTAGTNGTQANVVGLNNLYTGSGSPACTGKTFPTFTFSYKAGVGPVTTSPVLSTSGAKVAFVENDTIIGAILHVLTIGTGTEFATCASNTGSALPTCATTATVIPGSTASSNATDFMLPLGLVTTNAATALAGAVDSFSSPFVNYATDIAYVGDDNGRLYAISNVFLGTPAHAGGNFPVTVTSAALLTAPVLDAGGFNHIFIGDSTGLLKGYTSAGVALTGSGITVGVSNDGGVRDAPLVDSTNSVGYSVGCTGSGPGTGFRVIQFSFTATAMTTAATFTDTGNGGGCRTATVPVYNGTPTNNYFTKGISSATPASNGEIDFCASDNTAVVSLFQIQFTSKVMGTAVQFRDVFDTTVANETCSPLTEFNNATAAFTPTQLTSTTTVVTMTVPANSVTTGESVSIAGVAAGSGNCTAGNVANINGTRTVASTPSATTFTFNAGGTLSGAIAASSCGLSSATVTGTTDFLFLGTSAPEVWTFTLPLTIATQAATAVNTTSVTTGGTSAVIVDNNSTSGQAASIYFGTRATSTTICGGTAAFCAVKLTQSALQ